MLLQEYVFALVVMWVQHVLSGDLLAPNYSKVSHSGTAYSIASVKIGPSHVEEPFATNMSVVIGVQPKAETTKGSFVVYAERVTENTANESNEGTLPISEVRMSSGNMYFKPALGYLTQDTEYYPGPVYTAQERNETSYGNAHPASNMLGQDSSKLKTEQSELQPPLLTTNYSGNGQGNVLKTPEIFHLKEETPDKDSSQNDPDKQAHFLKLPQDSYNGPDSYYTTSPGSSKSPPLPPLGIYQLETPKEHHKAPDSHHQPQKPKESLTQHRDQYQIPSSTEFYKPIMLNLQPPDPNEPYKGHKDGYQFQPPKEIYEPQMGSYQYANMKEFMKQPLHNQKPPKPKESLTPPSDTYQLTKSEDSFTTPAKILQPTKSKDSFKPPIFSYHAIKSEDSLTPPVDMHNHPELVDLFKQHMDVHKPSKPQDILTSPVDMYEHPKLKDSYKPQMDRPQPQKRKYVFQGAMESYRPLPAKEIHKPLVLSPEEFYKPPMKSQIPSKDDNKMHSSSETLKELSQPSPLTHVNNQSEYTNDDMYLDYDPSTYVQTENSNGHAHNDSHENDYSEQQHVPKDVAEQIHAPEHDHSHKYPSHGYSGIYLHHHKPLVLSPEELYNPPMKSQIPSKDDNKMHSSSETMKELSQPSPLTHVNNQSEYTNDDIYLDYDPSTYVQTENSNGHENNDSHEYDYSEQQHVPKHVAEQIHAPEHDHSHKYPSHGYSGFYIHHHPPPHPPPLSPSKGAPPPPPKEINGVMPEPPKDKLEAQPSPAKEANGSLSPPPSEPHEAPSPSSKQPNGTPPPFNIGPYRAPMYLPKPTYPAPLPPPNYVYGIHAFGYPYGVPPPPPTTIPPPPPPPPPKRKRVGYYRIGRKLYLIPAVFSFLFLPYLLSYIIRSIIRHKVNLPFTYWQTARKIDVDENEMERRVARALEAVEKRYK